VTCGIYSYCSSTDGKRYIGQSINIEKRDYDHRCSLRNNLYKSHFQNAWNKFGEDNFKFEIMVVCAPEDLDFYEDLLIKGYKSNNTAFGYNLREAASSNRGMVFDRGIFKAGDKYGRLTLIKRVENRRASKSNLPVWLCRCDCGKECKKSPSGLKEGHIKSCGCLNSEMAKESVKKLIAGNIKHGLSKTTEYRSWQLMMDRCYKHNHVNYHRAGAQGIRVCQGWHNFTQFLKDMSNKPEGLFLGRKDVTKDYNKDNCYWANAKQLVANRRKRT
jgi:hypothetical protein